MGETFLVPYQALGNFIWISRFVRKDDGHCHTSRILKNREINRGLPAPVSAFEKA